MVSNRVLITGDTVGGVWTFTLDLAAALCADGIEVVLATFGDPPSHSQAAQAAAIPNLCLLTSSFKLEWMEDPWRDLEDSGHWLMQLQREFCPSLIHLNSFGHGALPWDVPAILTAHSCVLSWWEAVKGKPAPSAWNRYRDLVAHSLSSVDIVTAPSAAMARALIRHYGLTNCTVIPNGRDAACFHAAPKEPLILTAGRVWDEGKNVLAVASAAPHLSWPVYIAGDSRTLHFEHCHMLGHLSAPELANWYARASIYALPARYEPFGLSALEAALSGCALVLGDIESLREIWQGAALFVNSATLHQALQSLIDDPCLRETMAQRARARALTFTSERMSRAYLETYQAAQGLCVS